MKELIELLEAMAAQGFVIDTPHGTYRVRLDLNEGDAQESVRPEPVGPDPRRMSW